MCCPAGAWRILKTTFQAVYEAIVNEILSMLRKIELKKGEKIVAYSNWVV